jgi:hypothetical protein
MSGFSFVYDSEWQVIFASHCLNQTPAFIVLIPMLSELRGEDRERVVLRH